MIKNRLIRQIGIIKCITVIQHLFSLVKVFFFFFFLVSLSSHAIKTHCNRDHILTKQQISACTRTEKYVH